MPREETRPETPVPVPTPIVRFMHIDNLAACLTRGGLHAPNHEPDWSSYKTIHNANVQAKRAVREVNCAPGGVIHDYVSLLFWSAFTDDAAVEERARGHSQWPTAPTCPPVSCGATTGLFRTCRHNGRATRHVEPPDAPFIIASALSARRSTRCIVHASANTKRRSPLHFRHEVFSPYPMPTQST